MAAVTIATTSLAPKDLSSTRRRQCLQYTGPASYATGGDTGLADALGWSKVTAFSGVISNGTLTYLLWLSPSTGNVLIFDMAGAEVTALTDLSTFTGYVEAVGH